MKAYKGFSPAVRNKMDKELKEAIAKGEYVLKGVCAKCGQDKGVIDVHSHDYSHAYKYCEELCFRCHMVHHLEYKNFEASVLYWQLVYSGYTYPPLETRNIGEIFKMFNELLGGEGK